MALEVRNGRTYYYVYKRRRGKVKRSYRGCGEFAVWLQEEADLDREEREDERRQRAEADKIHREALELERRRGNACTILVGFVLSTSGFARYKSGPWKRRIMRSLPGSIELKGTAKKRLKAEIRRLVTDLFMGDKSTVHRLAAIARDHPADFADEVECNLPDVARDALADHEFATEEKYRDDLIARMHLVANELAGPSPSAARRMCAEVVSFAWGESWLLTNLLGANGVAKQQSLQLAQRLSSAQKRFLSALRTHAQIAAIEERRPRRTEQTIVDATFREG
jgi:hypothetical protein